MERIVVPAATATALEAAAGSLLRVTDPEGAPVGDLFCVSRSGPTERFSQAPTRVYLQRLSLRPGDALWSTRDRPLLTLVEDTVGVHDLLFCGCSRFVLETVLGRRPRRRTRRCADDVTDCNGGRCEPLLVDILAPDAKGVA